MTRNQAWRACGVRPERRPRRRRVTRRRGCRSGPAPARRGPAHRGRSLVLDALLLAMEVGREHEHGAALLAHHDVRVAKLAPSRAPSTSNRSGSPPGPATRNEACSDRAGWCRSTVRAAARRAWPIRSPPNTCGPSVGRADTKRSSPTASNRQPLGERRGRSSVSGGHGRQCRGGVAPTHPVAPRYGRRGDRRAERRPGPTGPRRQPGRGRPAVPHARGDRFRWAGGAHRDDPRRSRAAARLARRRRVPRSRRRHESDSRAELHGTRDPSRTPRAGARGLLAAGVCFILPAVVIVGFLAWIYERYGTDPMVVDLRYGILPVIIAIVGHALYGLGRSALTGVCNAAVALAAFAGYLAGVHELVLLVVAGTFTRSGRSAVDSGRIRCRCSSSPSPARRRRPAAGRCGGCCWCSSRSAASCTAPATCCSHSCNVASSTTSDGSPPADARRRRGRPDHARPGVHHGHLRRLADRWPRWRSRRHHRDLRSVVRVRGAAGTNRPLDACPPTCERALAGSRPHHSV